MKKAALRITAKTGKPPRKRLKGLTLEKLRP